MRTLFSGTATFFRLNPENDPSGVRGYFPPLVPQLLLGAAIIAVTTIVAFSTPAAAQYGCNPYVGGSCGYQDMNPPVRWHRQNPYYNGYPRHHRRYATGYLPGGAYYRGHRARQNYESFAHREEFHAMERGSYTTNRTCHDWIQYNGVGQKHYTNSYAC